MKARMADCQWLKPVLVGQIKFLERTARRVLSLQNSRAERHHRSDAQLGDWALFWDTVAQYWSCFDCVLAQLRGSHGAKSLHDQVTGTPTSSTTLCSPRRPAARETS
jgi:hypothetical protein